MQPQPLPKTLYESAKQLKLAKIHLCFSGGSDEGYLNINTELKEDAVPPNHTLLCSFEEQVEEWAWQVYDYSGAGDGSDYGDDITYDLVDDKVTFNEWYMVREDHPAEEMKLECANEETEVL